MEEKFRKYAKLLLQECLNVKAGQPLLISAPIETYPFVRVLTEQAYLLGVKDIYFDWEDEVLKRIQLENLNQEEISSSTFWNKSIFDEYAKKNSAFLMLYGFENEDLSKVDSELLGYTGTLFRTSRPLYKKRQLAYEVPWCIASAATTNWAKKIFPESEHALEDLWNEIFKICLVNEPDPLQAWEMKKQKNKQYCEWLNSLQLSTLHYENGLGTNFTIELPKNHIWEGTTTIGMDGKEMIVNMPSEEVFTSPKIGTAEGKLYSSKPLVYNGVLIEDFYFIFEKGKVVEVGAKKGLDVLKQILTVDDYACELGEVALVNFDSPISASGFTFYETLYDENAACHFALGSSFPKCLKGAQGKTPEELQKMGINQSKIHVDFMIGTEDLTIVGMKEDGEKVLIMENGNIVI